MHFRVLQVTLQSMTPMRVPNVGKLIRECWTTAEKATRDTIHEKHFDCDEELITNLFRGELREILSKVAAEGRVERAFLQDLKSAFHHADLDKLRQIATGLTATVSFHDRSLEGKTGGDLGILVVRPDVHSERWSSDTLSVTRDYKRGLLAQAKLFGRDGKWNGLTRSQKRVLGERLSYFALLLYRYLDNDEGRRDLKPFAWQNAADSNVPLLESWLKQDDFPRPQESDDLLAELLTDRIGTDDKKIIEEVIAPPQRESLEIRIHWPDGMGPGPSPIRITHETRNPVHQHAVVRY